ncbi:MAG TPA: hypothetical protein VLZ07_00835 [Syntrophales bacterium]|nr:hypothetical protein [Syntrophales bacterium]
MNAIDAKLMVAISAAIGAYLEEEAAALAVQAVEAAPAPAVAPSVAINLWAVAGRQDVMFTRRMWQLRTY